MRRLLPLTILLAALATARADTAALDAWLARQAEVRSLEARFTQERKLPALKDPVSAPGRLFFEKPGKVRWELGQPPETLAISDGKTLTLIDRRENTMRRIEADSPRAARFSMLSGGAFRSAESFRAAFEIVDWRVARGIHQYTLRAKDRRLRAEVPWVFIDIDPERRELRALELELRDKSRVRTVFHDPKFNVNFADGVFSP